MPTQFKIGDVVRLKSGGPSMTVSSIDGEEVYCVWFSASGDREQAHAQVFHPDCLSRADR